MLVEGKYSAWFRTENAEGMGVIELRAGRVTGGDTVLSYYGSYSQNGEQFTASIRTERHSPGEVALFGLDEIDLSITGIIKERTGSGVGHVKQVPNAVFKVVLVRMQD